MKRYRLISKPLVVTVGLLTIVFLIATGALAQSAPPPIGVHIYFDKSSFNLEDPNDKISGMITLENRTGAPLWTTEGFGDLDFRFYLIFQAPDKKIITVSSTPAGGSPTPPEPPPEVAVEELFNGYAAINMPLEDARELYELTQLGQYSVWVRIPFVQYDSAQVHCMDKDNDGVCDDADGDGIADRYFAPFDAGVWCCDLNSIESDLDEPAYITLTSFVPAVTSDVKAKCTEIVFAPGSRPRVSKQPLTGAEVRLYQRSAIEEAGISQINHRTYSRIATEPSIPYELFEETDTDGIYLFPNCKQDDYVIITIASRGTGYRYLGRKISSDDARWGVDEILKRFFLLSLHTGKKCPGRFWRFEGSELLIIEPEYVEWDSTQELYPFAFESVGDWDVEVSLETPEGFVADHSSLSENVSSELEGVQFTVTDVGSKWKATKVKYKVKHKKKTKKAESEVDVKLSRKLAKEKGVSKWGEEDEEESPKEKKKKKKK